MYQVNGEFDTFLSLRMMMKQSDERRSICLFNILSRDFIDLLYMTNFVTANLILFSHSTKRY